MTLTTWTERDEDDRDPERRDEDERERRECDERRAVIERQDAQVSRAKPAVQMIERGVWTIAQEYWECDSCGHMIILGDPYLVFPHQHGSLCGDCAAPLKRGEVRQ